MLRLAAGLIVGGAWLVTLPLAADAIVRDTRSAFPFAFVPVALLAAGLWWLHLWERRGRIGLAGGLTGWLFIGSVALLGASGSLWPLVILAVMASAVAYGVLLLVTQSGAASPRQDLVTGLLLFATGGASAMLALTTGLTETDAWWAPAHVMLAVGIGLATMVGARRLAA
ncbi:MAG: hypothetical protein ACRDFR_06155 [Candidatus Limnocylindria bacterium]